MERIIITLHIDDVGEKRVNVRKNLQVQGLIDEVKGRFDQFTDGNYGLRIKGQSTALDPERTLAQLSLEEDAELEFYRRRKRKKSPTLKKIREGERRALNTSENEVVLLEERRGNVFDIQWVPAVIGRPYQMDPNKNRLLAIDVSGIQGSEYVSRHHAAITEDGGQFAIEPLSKRNPTYVNEDRLKFGEQQVLQPGDRIRVGRIVLVFELHS